MRIGTKMLISPQVQWNMPQTWLSTLQGRNKCSKKWNDSRIVSVTETEVKCIAVI